LSRPRHPSATRIRRSHGRRVCAMSAIVDTALLPPTGVARLVDIGSGEMGFYGYSSDTATGRVSAVGVSDGKLKYEKGCTFADQFIFRESGLDLMCTEVRRRYGISAAGEGREPEPLVLCLTGANRQILRDDATGRERLEDFLRALNDRLRSCGVACSAYFPSGEDEALFELCATEFVLRHGDLGLGDEQTAGFAGTLSAGSGSCQLTLRAGPTGGPSVHSIPIGNRTPVVSMKLGTEHALFCPGTPSTRRKACDLLCDGEGAAETRPAWQEDGGQVDPGSLRLWRELAAECIREHGLPTQLLGMFVGISAVYHAAVEAGCDGKLLPRDEFLSNLQRRCDELLACDQHNGRAISNLTLIAAIVESVLSEESVIVCKRAWNIGRAEDKSEALLATWTLGLYLKQSGAACAA